MVRERINRNLRRYRLLAVAGLAMLLGCGDGRPETYPVRGTVTFQGKPVTSGRVIFYPESGRSAQGEIQADGTFELTTFERGDGAVLGKHRVTVKSTRVVQASSGAPKTFEEELQRGAGGQTGGGSKARVDWLVPEKFSQRATTTLAADVVSGENQVDLRIP